MALTEYPQASCSQGPAVARPWPFDARGARWLRGTWSRPRHAARRGV